MQPVQIIADLQQESNVQFLDFEDENEDHTKESTQLKSLRVGKHFSVSIMDSVTSSAFHSPGTLYIVEEIDGHQDNLSDCGGFPHFRRVCRQDVPRLVQPPAGQEQPRPRTVSQATCSNNDC